MTSASPTPLFRRVFLVTSGVVVAVVLALSNAVLLPFVLALLIAYLLTPLVAWVEARRVPRAASIIVVYFFVLGGLYLGIRLMAPRIGHELAGLRRELPTMVTSLRDDLIPSIERRLRDLGLAPAMPAPAEPVHDEPPFTVRPLPDGSYALDVGSGVAIQPTAHGGFVVTPSREPRAEHFDFDRAVADAVGKSFAYAQHNALELARIGRDIVGAVSRAFFITGITLMLAAYMMLTRERILGFFESLIRPGARADFQRLVDRIDQGLSGVVRGQLIICLLNGLLSAIGFAFVGLKYWPVLAILATLFSLIPIFGSIISSIPAVALGLTQSIGTAVFVLIWIVGIHQLEANVLNPKIMGDAAKIHPVLVIFSLLLGEHLFQMTGALLAVPCMSIAQSLFVHFRYVAEGKDRQFDRDPRPASIPPPAV
jgi:predicted PurR-regulated permease PerM